MQVCTDTSEAIELYPAQGLYLKPLAKVSISVQLPQMKSPGKSISNWEVMEKIKVMMKPDTFTVLKVTKSSLEFIRFEGEASNRACLKGIISRLENKTIKLSGFPEMLKVRAAEAKIPFPTRHDWDSYFRDAKNMNEMKPGERPDTVHFQNVPCRWFVNRKEKLDMSKPSEYILTKVFETFGEVRLVDIPMLDPYLRDITKSSGSIQTFSFSQDIMFEAFLQFKEYIGFVKAMTALRGMKLMHKDEGSKCFTVDMKVDFDKTKHLTEENIKKRAVEREKLIQLEKEREDRVHRERKEEEMRRLEERRRLEEEERQRELKRAEKLKRREERRWQREAKRRQRLLEKKRLAEEQKIFQKKALEERQKLVEQRRCEATRLLNVLLDRVKEDKKKEEVAKIMEELESERLRQLAKEQQKAVADAKSRQEEEEKRQKKLAEEERSLRERLLKNFKVKQERHEEEERERRRKELAGRTKLRSVLVPKVGQSKHESKPVQGSLTSRPRSHVVCTR